MGKSFFEDQQAKQNMSEREYNAYRLRKFEEEREERAQSARFGWVLCGAVILVGVIAFLVQSVSAHGIASDSFKLAIVMLPLPLGILAAGLLAKKREGLATLAFFAGLLGTILIGGMLYW